MADFDDSLEAELLGDTVESFVETKCRRWREHYESKYQEKFKEYYRLWRGQWDASDKTRKSERSRIIAPALQQAVESNVAELEEATFGRGRWFDIKDDYADEQKQDIEQFKRLIEEEFEKNGIRKAIGETLINAAVFGTGIAEVVLGGRKDAVVKTEPKSETEEYVGVEVEDRVTVELHPILPQNFLIDPVATCINTASGVATERYVPIHQIHQLQEAGVYRDVLIGDSATDTDLEADQSFVYETQDKVLLRKFWGLIPSDLLKECEHFDGEVSEGYYTEAVIVMADNVLLKCSENKFMMQDRPIIAFPWDVVPGRFWGRGVCEKGFNSQKALDAEIRARIDALALTIHPMMGVNANKVIRGYKPTIQPGGKFLTNGDPREALMPMNFGQVSQITFAQAAALQDMVQQSTGAIDSAGISGQVNGEATAAGISMSLGAIIKRHKRTLVNFQQSFLIPFVTKAAHRYMQFDPNRFDVQDYKFCATSSLGIIAREYEVTQLTQLLQTMPPNSPAYPVLIESIIDNMNLSNGEQIKDTLRQAQQETPEQKEAREFAEQLQRDEVQGRINVLRGEAEKTAAQARKTNAEADNVDQEMLIRAIEAITNDLKDNQEDNSLERRLALLQQIIQIEGLAEGIKNDNATRANENPDSGTGAGSPSSESTGGGSTGTPDGSEIPPGVFD